MESKSRLQTFLILVFCVTLLSGCDPERLKQCEWYLVPEERHADYVDAGWVSICARNYVLQRERCYLKMKLAEAEKAYGKPVTFDSLELSRGGIKDVKAYAHCTPSPEDQALEK